MEQTSLFIRYVKLNEHFICFDNFSDKTGQEIA